MRSFAAAALIASSLVLISMLSANAFSTSSSNDNVSSLSAFRKARAQQTSNQLDASRFHFSILFVDDDNFHGRIAQGMLAKIVEYNDAICALFPYSATIEDSPEAPLDSSAPIDALFICESLELCYSTCAEDGTSFTLSSFDEYDLIIALNDEVQSLITRSLPMGEGYDKKCCTLSEFISVDFCGVQSKNAVTKETLQEMIEPSMWQRVKHYFQADKEGSISFDSALANSRASDVNNPPLLLSQNGGAIINPNGWPLAEAAMVVACAGITRFCLDTMDAQFDTAFSSLLDRHFYQPKHLDISIEDADDQLRRGSLSITGYFSPKERYYRICNHFDELRTKLL